MILGDDYSKIYRIVIYKTYLTFPLKKELCFRGLLGGIAMGGLTALAGSIMPAWTACRIKVSEVFARVA